MTRKAGDWWDKSWSVVTGCTPAGAGCYHCWARSLIARFPVAHGPAPFSTVRCHPERLDEPLRRRKPTVYAVSLLGDLFHEQVPQEFIATVLATIGQCDRHAFCVLTKRWNRAALILPRLPYPNVILLASVWDQASADAASAALSTLRGVRWGLHAEPLLGPIELAYQPPGANAAVMGNVSWVVCGGENGPGARPMEVSWADQLRDQCETAGVPFWFKGWGLLGPAEPAGIRGMPGVMFREKRPKHRLLCGVEHNGVPWSRTGEPAPGSEQP